MAIRAKPKLTIKALFFLYLYNSFDAKVIEINVNKQFKFNRASKICGHSTFLLLSICRPFLILNLSRKCIQTFSQGISHYDFLLEVKSCNA